MREIHGMGDAKLERYGTAFLDDYPGRRTLNSAGTFAGAFRV